MAEENYRNKLDGLKDEITRLNEEIEKLDNSTTKNNLLINIKQLENKIDGIETTDKNDNNDYVNKIAGIETSVGSIAQTLRSEKDRQITEKKRKADEEEEKKNRVLSMENELKVKDSDIKNKENLVAEKESEIEKLNEMMNELKSKREKLESDLNEKNTQIQNQKREYEKFNILAPFKFESSTINNILALLVCVVLILVLILYRSLHKDNQLYIHNVDSGLEDEYCW